MGKKLQVSEISVYTVDTITLSYHLSLARLVHFNDTITNMSDTTLEMYKIA